MEFEGEIARKSGEPELLAIEAEKSRRAGVIGQSSGLFRVPRVLRLNESEGTLEFKREPHLITFSHFVASGSSECEEAARRAGRAIARVHNELQLDPSMWTLLPDPWSHPDDENVPLHGDFTAQNLCIDRESLELVIVDWSAAPVVGRRATAGPRCFDLLCFARHLIISAPWRQTYSWPGRTLSDHLIQAYVEEVGSSLPRASWDRHKTLLTEFAERSTAERLAATPLYARVGKSFFQRHLLETWRSYQPPAGVLQ